MRQVFGIVRYNFFGFLRNPKVIFVFLLEFVLSFLLTGRIMVVMETYDTPVQAIEPFIWTFGDGIAVLSSSLLLLLMFSDLPKMTPITPYQLTRTTKRKWLLGQFIYVILVTVLYTVLMLLFTAVLCMRNCGHAWLFRIRKKPAGPFYSKGHGKYLTLWLYAAGFLPSVLLFADLKLCNPCRKSL
mgnify:CR=1 FL=1